MNRRWRAAAIVAAAIALVAILWRTGEPERTAAAVTTAAPAPAPATPARPARAPGRLAPSVRLGQHAIVSAATPTAPGTLEGTVVDAATEAGIAGAVLTFSRDNGVDETVTEPRGGFRFAPREVGRYQLVSVEARGYLPFQSELGRSPVSFTSVRGRDVSGIVVRLVAETAAARASAPLTNADGGARDRAATGLLRGRVLDARTRSPIAAFAVALWRRDGIAYSEMLAPATFIDPSGVFEIGGLAAGPYEATAMAAGYAGSPYAVVGIADAPVDLEFALHAGARVSGVIHDDASGRPVADVEVSIEGRRGDAPDLPAAPLSPVARSDGTGAFVLEHVAPDAVGLAFAKEGYLSRLVSLGPVPEDGDVPPLSIRLTRPDRGSDARVELTGIGATLRAQEDALVVLGILPDAGASDAGLAVGDRILTIDAVAVAKLGYEGSISAIRGPEGTTVSLRVRRAWRDFDVVVTRKRWCAAERW